MHKAMVVATALGVVINSTFPYITFLICNLHFQFSNSVLVVLVVNAFLPANTILSGL